MRSAKLNWDKAAFELVSKREAVNLATSDLNQAETVLRMHEIRATLSGAIKTIYKKDLQLLRQSRIDFNE